MLFFHNSVLFFNLNLKEIPAFISITGFLSIQTAFIFNFKTTPSISLVENRLSIKKEVKNERHKMNALVKDYVVLKSY